MIRQIIILGVLGVASSGVLGYFLYGAWSTRNEAETARNEKMGEIQSIYRAKVFPSLANVKQLRADTEGIHAWRDEVTNLFSAGAISVDTNLSPSAFKQLLVRDIRQLSSEFRIQQNQKAASFAGEAPAQFGFSFDRYIGDTLPDSANVARLNRQWDIIKLLCAELRKAGVNDLTGVDRERFDEKAQQQEEEPQEGRRRNRRRRNRDAAEANAPTAHAFGPKAYQSKERFSLAFRARPDVIVHVLNGLAKMDLFTVVADVGIAKTGDQISEYLKRRAEAEAAAKVEASRQAAAPSLTEAAKKAEKPKRAIVTDPELDKPSNVNLVVDVYSF